MKKNEVYSKEFKQLLEDLSEDIKAKLEVAYLQGKGEGMEIAKKIYHG